MEPPNKGSLGTSWGWLFSFGGSICIRAIDLEKIIFMMYLDQPVSLLYYLKFLLKLVCDWLTTCHSDLNGRMYHNIIIMHVRLCVVVNTFQFTPIWYRSHPDLLQLVYCIVIFTNMVILPKFFAVYDMKHESIKRLGCLFEEYCKFKGKVQ